MKITTIIAFLVSMSISSSTNALEISAYETFDESLSGIYISGVANGIWYLQVYYSVDGSPRLFCLPSDISLGGQLAKTALQFYDGPKDVSVSLGVIEGLKKMFPCE
jgi:hypothetical protein